jgi:hypothetical protein
VDLSDAQGPLTIVAELRYQPIGYRWARHLGAYDAMAAGSSVVLARASTPLE